MERNKSFPIGRFQLAIAIIFIVGFNTGGFLFYNLSLLELQPKYICYDLNHKDKGEFECKAEDFCENPAILHWID